MEIFTDLITGVYECLLYLTNWPLAVVLLAGGMYFSLRTGFIQRKLPETLKYPAKIHPALAVQKSLSMRKSRNIAEGKVSVL